MAGRKTRLVYRQDPDGIYRARPEVKPIETKTTKKVPTPVKAAPATIAQPKYATRVVEPEDNELKPCGFKVPNWNTETDSPVLEPPTSKSAEYVHALKPSAATGTTPIITTSAVDMQRPVVNDSHYPTVSVSSGSNPSPTIGGHGGVTYHLKEQVISDDTESYLDLQAGLEPSPLLERLATVASEFDLKSVILGGILGFIASRINPFLLSHTNDIVSTIKFVILTVFLVIATCGWLGVLTVADLIKGLLRLRAGVAYIIAARSHHTTVVPPTSASATTTENHIIKEENPEGVQPVVVPVTHAAPAAPVTPVISSSPPRAMHTETERVERGLVPEHAVVDEHDGYSVVSEESKPDKKMNRPRARSLSPVKENHRPSNVYVNITPYKADPRRMSGLKQQQGLGLPRSQSAAEWRVKPSSMSNGHNIPLTRTPSGSIPSRITTIHTTDAFFKDRPSIQHQSLDSPILQFKKLPPQPDEEDLEDLPFINKVNSMTSQELDQLNRQQRRNSAELGLSRSMSNGSRRSALHTRANYTKFVSNAATMVPEVEQF